MNILVIEDEHGDAHLAQSFLRGQSFSQLNFEITSALSQGLERLSQGGVDVVLLGLDLPDSQGLETYQRVQLHAPDVPIVLLSDMENEGQLLDAECCPEWNGSSAAKPDEGVLRATRLAQERSHMMEVLKDSKSPPTRQEIDPYKRVSELISDYAYSFLRKEDGSFFLEWATNSFQHITGYGPEDLEQMGGLPGTVYPGDLPIAIGHQQQASQGFSPTSEFRILTKAGEARWLRHQTQVVWDDAENRLAGFYGVGQDITERKQAEQLQQALFRISETASSAQNLNEMFALIHGIISDLIPAKNFYISLYDPDTNVIEFPYFVDEFDQAPVPRQAQHGLTDFVLRTGQPLLALPEVFEDLVSGGDVLAVGAPCVDWLGVPLKNADDQTIGALVVQTYTEGVRYTERDLNLLAFVSRQVALTIERKRSDQELRESEERYRTLVENLPIGIARTTPGHDGRYLMANPAYMAMFGFESEEELLAAHAADLYADPQDRALFSDLLLTRGSISGLEQRFRRKDGTILWGSVTSRVETDRKTGEVLYFNNTIEDITQRKQRERERDAIVAAAAALRLASSRKDTFNVVLDQLLTISDANAAEVALLDSDGQEIVLEMTRGPDADPLIGLRLPSNQCFIAQVALTGKPALNYPLPDNPSTLDSPVERHLDFLRGFRSVAVVPLIVQSNGIGALTIASQSEISEEELRLFVAVADLAAGAIHRITLYEETQRRLQRLTSLRTINTAINASLDLRLTLNVLVNQIVSQKQADAAGVLLLNPHTLMLEYAAGEGFRYIGFERTRVRLGSGQAGKAALDRVPVYVPDLSQIDDTKTKNEWQSQEGFVAYYALPLIVKGQVKGVLETFYRKNPVSDPEWLEFLESLASSAAIAIDGAELLEKLRLSNEELVLAYNSTIEGWSNALDMRDSETEGHSRRVADGAVRLARAMGVQPVELMHIWRGALLHDIGKMAIPDDILLKRGPLTEDEWQVIRQHPQNAYNYLSSITFLRPALEIPYAHHERWDGAGYPRRLSQKQIPLAARIFSIVDVWDALTSDRPYRPAWPKEKALDYICEQSGKHFDPQVVDAFLELMQSGRWSATD